MIKPEDLEELLKNASDEEVAVIKQMLDEVDLVPVEEKAESMTASQYARRREEEMSSRSPIEEEETEEEEEPESVELIMYSDFLDDQEEDEEETPGEYYQGDELESQIDILKELENSVGAGKKDGKWYPHVIDEDETIVAYGHKVTAEEEEAGTYDDGLTEEEAIELLKKDIDEANVKVRDKIQDFDSFPFYLKMELVNSAYRGLIQDSPNTLELINKGDFAGAAKEFTNNVPAYKESKGIKKRMDRVVDALNRYAEEVDE